MNFKSFIDRVVGTRTVTKQELHQAYDDMQAEAIAQMKAAQEEQPREILINGNGEEMQGSGEREDAFVVFSITKKGEARVNIGWEDDEEITANALASLLFCINSGKMTHICSEYLKGLAIHETDTQPFVKQLVNKWSELAGENTPVMRPTEVWPQQIGGQHINIRGDED